MNIYVPLTDKSKLISKLFEASTPALCEIWKPLLSVFKKKLCVWRPFPRMM